MRADSHVKRPYMVRLASVTLVALMLSLYFVAPVHPTEGWSLGLGVGPGVQAEKLAMSVAADAGGRPWAVWMEDDGNDTDIYYSRWTGRAWQTPRPLSANPEIWEESPSLAFAADGIPWVAWSASDGPEQTSILVSQWTGQHWSTAAPVPGTAALGGRQPAMAAAPDGSLWLAWVGDDGVDREIFASHWDGMGWSDPQRVGDDDTDPLAYDTHPRVAVDGMGQAWLVWVSHTGPLSDEIQASHWDGTTWSAQRRISADDDTPDAWPSLVLDAGGQPWVAWHGAAPDREGRWRTYFSHWDKSAATWSAESPVSSSPGLGVDERRPSLAFDADGQLHIAWAISGRISGFAHATWDGATWTAPTWTETSDPVEAPTVVADGDTKLLWLSPDGAEAAPVKQQGVKEMIEPLPHSVPLSPAEVSPATDYVPNRHLAHGDSITCGCYDDIDGQPAIPYPTFLEELLDAAAGPSEVINSGKPGEKARAARPRLKSSVQTYTPQYVLIHQGTNDLTSNYNPAETAYAIRLLVRDTRDESGIPGIRIMVSTLIPRTDHRNGEVYATNQEIYNIARRENVPVADPWTAFYDYGPWEEFMLDRLHPGTTGLQILANAFYQALVDTGWLPTDGNPPTAQITSLPPQSDCTTVPVAWTGDDGGGSGVASFDVQVQDNGGPWIDWLVETPENSGNYFGAKSGHTLGFRVRARDLVGNIGNYSAAAESEIVDSTPPYSASVAPLPAYRTIPFDVSWSAFDTCSQVSSYDVEYRVENNPWVRWLSQTMKQSDSFKPTSFQCGQTYSFRVRAYDEANNVSSWSNGLTSTTLVCDAVSGYIGNVREMPVLYAQVSAAPAELSAEPSDVTGYYNLYFNGAGDYDITVERDGFGVLPARQDLAVGGVVNGVDFYLPPLDDQVDNGGFERVGWGDWQRAGSNPPAVTSVAHTGGSAAQLDPQSGESRLSQSLSLPVDLTRPTLSFMVRLANGTGPASTLRVKMIGTTTATENLVVSSGGWVHAWYDAAPFAGQTISLELAVVDDPAIIVDEVSLGSAKSGGSLVYLPLVDANSKMGLQQQ